MFCERGGINKWGWKGKKDRNRIKMLGRKWSWEEVKGKQRGRGKRKGLEGEWKGKARQGGKGGKGNEKRIEREKGRMKG